MHEHFNTLVQAARLALLAVRPGVDIPDETIDGFPEYAFTADTIKDPAVMRRMRNLAKRIVQSHHGGTRRIIGFEAHGHSDVALRISPGGQRERTEMEVSRDRAENARELLLRLVVEEGGRPIIAGIEANATAKAFGSRHAKFRPARSPAEMRKNRRVEIFLKVFEQPAARPLPPRPPPPRPQPEVGMNWRIQIRSGRVLSLPNHLFDLTPVRVTLVVELTDLDRNESAIFEATSSGIGLPGGTAGPPPPVTLVPGGDPTDFGTTSGVTLNRFVGPVEIGQNPSIGLIVTKGGEFVFSFNALRPASTKRGPVEVAAGFSMAPLPTAGGGFAPVSAGSMTIQSRSR